MLLHRVRHLLWQLTLDVALCLKLINDIETLHTRYFRVFFPLWDYESCLAAIMHFALSRSG
jgi:ABC-type transport system involved in cytochrome bd biosynthesis fused ATPase/permease subunit